MVNGNVSTEYVNLAPISLVEENALVNGMNPNNLDFVPATDITLSLGAVEGGVPNEILFTLTPLVNANIDFGDGEFGSFSALNETGAPATATIVHTYPEGGGTYDVVVTAHGCTPLNDQVVVSEPNSLGAKPDSTWTKAAIKDWLDDKGISYPTPVTKAELLALVP